MTPELLITILIIIGLGLIAIGIWMLMRERKKKALCTAQTQAEVIRYDEKTERTTEDGHVTTTTYYYPVYKYTVNGTEYISVSTFGTNRRKWPVGTQLGIFYNEAQPDMMRSPGEHGGYFGFAIAAFLGLVCLLFAILAAAGVLEINM